MKRSDGNESSIRRVSNEKTVEMEVLEEEICRMTKELETKEMQNKEEGQVFALQAEDVCEQIEELKKESTPFATRYETVIKLLEVAQAHYQKFIKLIRRKKK
ncbi:hypothetical protein Goarm_006424, partial [Gossypium armourianum]|nr:hypothetical protein [Gossypium armourianum]